MAARSISDAASPDAVRQVALRLLAPAPLTCDQLRRKLRSRHFDVQVVAGVIEELVGHHVLDDGDYARRWLEQRRGRGYGRTRIAAELQQRGVGAAEIDAALAEEPPEVERETAEQAARRQLPRLDGLEPSRARAKLARHLQNRGFGGETIQRIVEQLGRFEEG